MNKTGTYKRAKVSPLRCTGRSQRSRRLAEHMLQGEIMAASELTAMPNMGQKVAKRLNEIGIFDRNDLKRKCAAE